ncbi:nucleolar protein 6 isoform X2 [Aethina tumida]|uniref:nucleolar protein 6 isoform X2 n=1 Tax=Aethina tumida TaxID=116153 RepID=UPI002148FAF7|nr:nucleolar protein 6 isoform X2 [Aethina tumida]
MEFEEEMFDDLIDSSGSDDDAEESVAVENNKRKARQDKQTLKKVKYEDISQHSNKKNKKDLFKPPTVEELNELKQTENLFNNNLFRLQIKELITEIEIKNKRKKFINNWLEAFKDLINNIKEYEGQLSNIKSHLKTKNKTEKFLSQLANKYDNYIKTDQDVSLKFKKPKSVEPFGNYENNCLAGPNLVYKVNLKMPHACFHIKDFLNNRYIVKRYYYLLYIAEEICSSNIISSISLINHEDNHLLPILNITPTDCDKVIIQIYATPEDEYFKAARSLPNQNNIRTDLFGHSQIENLENLKKSPTLLYNCTLGHDFTLSINTSFIKSVLNEQTNIQEGIKLLSVWINQRELNQGVGSFSESVLLYFIVYLTTKRKINNHMSSYQVVRNFWNFIASTDLHETPYSICDYVAPDVLNNFKDKYEVVLIDRSGCYNVLGFMNYEFYKKVKNECEMALKHLDDNRVNSFQTLFLTKLPFHLQYDLVLNLSNLPNSLEVPNDDIQKAQSIGYNHLLVIKTICDVLKQGLNKRVLNLVPKITNVGKNGIPEKIFLGINLDPDHAFSFIEHGPALNDHINAAKFRKFWGSLSSDRRFRDGSTKVAVYFKTRTIQEKRFIVKKIIDFLLGEKLKLSYKMYYEEFEKFLRNKIIFTPYPLGTNEEASLKVITTSEELNKILRELKMSLSITGVQGVSDVYSYTDVFPPLATNYEVEKDVNFNRNNIVFSNKNDEEIPRYIQSLDNVLQLEHSSKWPNNLDGVRYLKTSFYLEMSKLLKTEHKILTSVKKDYIEVFYKGFIFRYRIYVPKEISLVKKESDNNGITCYKETLESFNLDLNLNVLPKIISALKGIQAQHPSFGPGTALIKRWLRSQLIDEYLFPNVVIDLLNASLYLSGTSLLPNTPQISFLRFLKFFSEAQWDLQPVLVNFNDEIEKEAITDLEGKLQQNRSAHQPLYIITPFDEGRSIFTKHAPTKEVLKRVQSLATVTLNFYSQKLLEAEEYDVMDLFTPNWQGYNLLIHLNSSANPRVHEQIIPPLKTGIFVEKYDPKKKSKIPITNFNPVELYLKELRENYGEYASFFYDSFGGNTIGVLWNPKVFETKEFKVSHVNGRKLEDGKLVFNLNAIVEDFYILGSDLVNTIEMM